MPFFARAGSPGFSPNEASNAGLPRAGVGVSGGRGRGRASCVKKCWGQVVFGRKYRYDEIMSGKEVKMNKSHRVAMAQALLAELSEATARYGAGNEGVKRLHRLVRDMVAQLLA